jgi:hypothetical protein
MYFTSMPMKQMAHVPYCNATDSTPYHKEPEGKGEKGRRDQGNTITIFKPRLYNVVPDMK